MSNEKRLTKKDMLQQIKDAEAIFSKIYSEAKGINPKQPLWIGTSAYTKLDSLEKHPQRYKLLHYKSLLNEFQEGAIRCKAYILTGRDCWLGEAVTVLYKENCSMFNNKWSHLMEL